MPFVELPDAQIHYMLEGSAEAPLLVFSNSLGTNFSMWDAQAAEFRKTFQILRYDTRGHGQSSVTAGPYSIEQLGKDVLGLLDALHLTRVHFCGLSMGGMIGMWLGVNAPDRLGKLVLCNTAAKIGTQESWGARLKMVRSEGMNEVGSAVVERWFTPTFRAKDPATVAATQRVLAETSPDGYSACCEAIRDFDYLEKLGGIRAPTLVISGAHDPVTTPADGRFLAEHIQGGRFAELNAAHLSNMEDGANFSRQVGTFLRG